VPLSDAIEVVDLGCGPGNSTQLLRHRWPHARIQGVDNSEEMLTRARADWPAGEWVCSDAGSFQFDGRADLIFSNALLQWLPDHAAILPRWVQQLEPGGVLALQMPDNFEEPSHRLMRSQQGPWGERLASVRSQSPVHSAAFYYDLLAPHVKQLDIWRTTYQHVIPSAASIVEWVKGTGIRPFLAQLSNAEQATYLEGYLRDIEAAYPLRADGKRLFPFPRLFIVAVR
jgi:trans-aconitate 2-methyltransferase